MFFQKEFFWSIEGFSEDVIFEDQDIALKMYKKHKKKLRYYPRKHVHASARRVKKVGLFNYVITDVRLFMKDRMGIKTDWHEEYFNKDKN